MLFDPLFPTKAGLARRFRFHFPSARHDTNTNVQ
jgi:hypothetical protein